MKTRSLFPARPPTLILAAAVAILALGSSAIAAQENLQKLKAANESFYSALNTMFTGDVTPMIALWSHGSDTTYLGPDGGYLKGWNPILADWKKQAAMKLGGKAVATRALYLMDPVGGIAVVQDVENITTDKGEKLFIRATNVYRMEGGAWKMVSHHVDKLPSVLK